MKFILIITQCTDYLRGLDGSLRRILEPKRLDTKELKVLSKVQLVVVAFARAMVVGS